MRVIGHRGAAGLAAENSISAIKAAIAAGVDAVEFDIRLSKDGKLFLCHDPSLQRTHDVEEHIANLTSHEIKKLKTKNGDHVPSLEEALKTCHGVKVFIEAKGSDWANQLAKVVSDHPDKSSFKVISFNHQELFEFTEYCPEIPCYVLEHRNPFDAINAARLYNFSGIDVNYWTLNPLAYHLARRHNLDIAVFTVDKPWIAKLMKIFYSDIWITTNYPNKFQFLRRKTSRRKRK